MSDVAIVTVTIVTVTTSQDDLSLGSDYPFSLLELAIDSVIDVEKIEFREFFSEDGMSLKVYMLITGTPGSTVRQ